MRDGIAFYKIVCFITRLALWSDYGIPIGNVGDSLPDGHSHVSEEKPKIEGDIYDIHSAIENNVADLFKTPPNSNFTISNS